MTNLSPFFKLAVYSWSDIERVDNWKLWSNYCQTAGTYWDQSIGRYELNRYGNQEAEEYDEEGGGVHSREDSYARAGMENKAGDGKAGQDCSLCH